MELIFFWPLSSYITKCKLGGSTEHLTINDGFKVMAYAKYSVQVTTQFGNFGIHAVTKSMLGWCGQQHKTHEKNNG